MISVVIVNFNEEKKLEFCLQSVVNLADEIVVIDLGSTDQSKEVAKKFNCQIFSHKLVPYVELIRNYAVEKVTKEWILVLDPDEIITSELKSKLKEVAKQDKFVAVNIPRKNIFFNKWIKHTNWWPDRHVRFFRKGKVRWSNELHVYPRVEGEVLNLPANQNLAIAHFGYDTIREFIDRQNRYSEIEAENLHEVGKRFSWVQFFWRPTREFLVRFLRHAGFLDGFYGLALTFLMMIYQLQVMVKLWELEREK